MKIIKFILPLILFSCTSTKTESERFSLLKYWPFKHQCRPNPSFPQPEAKEDEEEESKGWFF